MNRLVALALLAVPLAASADPLALTHQGYLLGSGDVPVEDPAITAVFKLYNTLAVADSAERLIWESRPCTLAVKGGRYVVVLGSEACNGATPLATEHLPTTQARFLEITIAGDRLLPRLAVTAAPVAAVARNAELIGGLDLAGLDARFDARYAPLAGGAGSGYAVLNAATAQEGSLKLTGGVTAGSATISGVISGTSATVAGTVTASEFVGSGVGLTDLDANRLSSGTLPDGRLSGPYTGALSFTNAANLFKGDGAGLLAVDAAKLGGLSLSQLDERYARVSGGSSGTVAFGGALKIGNGPTDCNAAAAGTIRWDGTDFVGCDGAAWRQLNNARPPLVTSVSPVAGMAFGGTTITLGGQSFAPGAAVTIDGVPCPSVTYVSSSQLRVVTVAGAAGAKDVKVINPDRQESTLAGGFSYVQNVFSYTGSDQTFAVPQGVSTVTVKLWGGGGGGGRQSSVRGGAGGYTTGTLAVTPGQTYVVMVGGGGKRSATTAYPAGVGGGLSGFFLSSVSQSNARLIAGGGGGGAYYTEATYGSSGGNGGGLEGGDGAWPGSSYYDSRGRGGTQSSGGAGGVYGTQPGSAGGALQGGVGGIYAGGGVTAGTYGGGGGSGGVASYDSGGGGGGYFGGGGGSNNAPLGGGGGSGFVSPSATNGSTIRSDTPGIPPNLSDPHYASGAAYGGFGLSAGDGAPGRVVVIW